MVCPDYQARGLNGEPQVIHIDQEWDYRIVFVAECFEASIRGLGVGDDTAFRRRRRNESGNMITFKRFRSRGSRRTVELDRAPEAVTMQADSRS